MTPLAITLVPRRPVGSVAILQHLHAIPLREALRVRVTWCRQLQHRWCVVTVTWRPALQSLSGCRDVGEFQLSRGFHTNLAAWNNRDLSLRRECTEATNYLNFVAGIGHCSL